MTDSGAASRLPDRLTSFVGRKLELAQVTAALERSRIVTLTGVGGGGKTRLALKVARAAAERYPDGRWWVELGSLASGEGVANELCSALGVVPLAGSTPLDAAEQQLRPLRALVVFDTCEHLLTACAEAIDRLVRACPNLTVLATSRAPLGVEGEHAWRVPSLELPAGDGSGIVDAADPADAVRLFTERARQVRPDFSIDADTAPAIARICRNLDGIPLAIELAAARTRVLSVSQIADALGDRFGLLAGATYGVLARQRTLRASVDWSHDLLSLEERIVLRRLGVFAGGWTLDAGETVATGNPVDRTAVLDLLTALVDQSLVQVDDGGAAARYRLLDTVRHYALEHLDEAGEGATARDRHLAVMLDLVETAAPRLTTHDQSSWLDRVDAEAANLAAALEHAATTDPDLALRLCIAQTRAWKLRGRFSEAFAAFARALDAGGSPRLRARALWGRSHLEIFSGSLVAGLAGAKTALAAAEAEDDEATAARAILAMATVAMFTEPITVVGLSERAIALARRTGDEWCVVSAHQMAGHGHLTNGRYDQAATFFDAVDHDITRSGDSELLAWNEHGRAWRHFPEGDLNALRAGMRRTLAAARAIGEPVTEALALARIAEADVEQGAAPAALATMNATLATVTRGGTSFALPFVGHTKAVATAALGRLDEAAALLDDLVSCPAPYPMITPVSAWVRAIVLLGLGRVDEAAVHATAVLRAGEDLPNPWYVARGHLALARAECARENWVDADRHVHAGLDTIIANQYRLDHALALEILAEVAAGLDSHQEAARLLGAAARARDERGLLRWSTEVQRIATLEMRLASALGQRGAAESTAEGAEISTEEALAWARRARGQRARPSTGWASLTPTEIQVIHHVADGLTNPQIGGRMFISRATVKTHLSSILRKLDMNNRAEVAAAAARRETHGEPTSVAGSDQAEGAAGPQHTRGGAS